MKHTVKVSLHYVISYCKCKVVHLKSRKSRNAENKFSLLRSRNTLMLQNPVSEILEITD